MTRRCAEPRFTDDLDGAFNRHLELAIGQVLLGCHRLGEFPDPRHVSTMSQRQLKIRSG